MKLLVANGYTFSVDTFVAATEGNLESMEWLLENKCPWDLRKENIFETMVVKR